MKLFNYYRGVFYTTGVLSKWVNIYMTNPFRNWMKVRKYFKRPKLKCHFFLVYKTRNYPYASYRYLGKILDIHIDDVQWKDKYCSPRHERNPLIYICLFKKFGFSITFSNYYIDEFGEKKDLSSYYWEYLLQYLYYDKPLSYVANWEYDSRIYKELVYGKAEDGSDDKYIPFKMNIPIVAYSLNKRGISKLKEGLNKK